MSTLRRLYDLLTPGERRRAGLLLAMILCMALLDVAGIASIMPFIAVLSNPGSIETNAILSWLYRVLGYTDTASFLLTLGVIVLVILVLSIAFKALTTHAQLRFIYMREYSIARRLAQGYLHHPYSWFLNKNSSELGKAILSEVAQVINNAMMPMMLVITQGTVAVALLVLLFVVNPTIAVVIGLALGGAYALIYISVRGYLGKIGEDRWESNQERFSTLGEAFGGIKEVKLLGLEERYVERFARPAEIFASRQAASLVIAQLPRFALEALAFGGLLVVVLYLLRRDGTLAQHLPLIALYGFAGYRLMPAVQQVYGGLTQLRFARPALEALHTDLEDLAGRVELSSASPLLLGESITLRDVSYRYPEAERTALENVNITISAHSTVAFVGTTGSGKTTAVDLILGLLIPDRGTVEVDGVPITDSNRRVWQKTIGYVPQQIFLADDTIEANIAFGVDHRDIDHAAVERAARIANLHDFVLGLPAGYATEVGERGVRLSGGQRQRIGVARALYHQPSVLVLDEATSALDNITERAVMDAVDALTHQITIIIIAHRLSTVRNCDHIFLLRSGSLAAEGRYDELVSKDETFRSMTATS